MSRKPTETSENPSERTTGHDLLVARLEGRVAQKTEPIDDVSAPCYNAVMRRFVTSDVPAWRIVLWGVIATLAVLAGGLYLSGHADYRLLVLAAFAGALFSGFGFFLLWSTPSGWAARNLKTLLVIFVVSQA